MVEFLTLSDFTLYNQIKDCWNEEMGDIYPISEKLFLDSVVNNKEILKESSYIALDEHKVVGFILAKAWNEHELIPYYNQVGWISLFFVNKKHRKQGIGTTLLKNVEQTFINLGKLKIILGTDTYNFFPGLPVDLVNHRQWFLKRGFTLEGQSHDMIRHFHESSSLLLTSQTSYEVRIATSNDSESIMEFFHRCFKGRWEYEANNYFIKGGTGREFVIMLDGKKVIAFSRINDQYSPEVLHNINWSSRFTNLAGVGPLGVDSEYRKRNLGFIVTAFAVNEAQKRGCSECIIDWTGLVDFYRLFKFEVWKTYDRLEKKIN
jgi:GNAT superfamily N-acetyltransferase